MSPTSAVRWSASLALALTVLVPAAPARADGDEDNGPASLYEPIPDEEPGLPEAATAPRTAEGGCEDRPVARRSAEVAPRAAREAPARIATSTRAAEAPGR